MKITIETNAFIGLNKNTSEKLSNLVKKILDNHEEVEKRISLNSRQFPDDEWVECCGIDLHLERVTDGSRRTRRVITAFNTFVAEDGYTDTDTDYFVNLKVSR